MRLIHMSSQSFCRRGIRLIMFFPLYRFLVVTLHSTERDSRINYLEIKFRILGVQEFSRQRRSHEIDTSSECFHSSPWL